MGGAGRGNAGGGAVRLVLPRLPPLGINQAERFFDALASEERVEAGAELGDETEEHIWQEMQSSLAGRFARDQGDVQRVQRAPLPALLL